MITPNHPSSILVHIPLSIATFHFTAYPVSMYVRIKFFEP